MGRIYEAIRKLKQDDIQPYLDDEELEYVQFIEFIAILELHADDSIEMIAQYLINHDEFLKLDYFFYGPAFSFQEGDEDFKNEFKSADEHEKPDILNRYSKYIFHKKKYDEVRNEDDIEYPTETFLEEILEEQLLEENFEDKYWKVEDLINLECLKIVNLNRESFNECREALHIDANKVLEYKKKNDELLKQVELFESIEAGEFKKELIEARLTIKNQDKEIKALLAKIETLKEKAISENDKPLHPRTANNASKIIGALTSELLNMDLTQPYTESSNGVIKKAIEIQGNTMSKDVIANWLTLAHKNTRISQTLCNCL